MSRNLLYSARFYVALFVLVLLFTFVGSAHCQVSVAIAPDPHPQFVNGSGQLLSGGFLYTYQAGTTTFLNTYTDSTGTIQNLDPIPLDATGAPSNGSVGTGIWLANAAYKFCAYNSSMVQQWCADNLTGYLGLLNLANNWSFQQTFTLPLIDSATDNQIVLGSVGNATTLDFPPPTGNVTLHFPNVNDTLVGRTTTDTLTNKTLSSPTINTPVINGCAVVNGPGTYICVPNDASTGTAFNRPVKYTGGVTSHAIITSISDTHGIIGICVSNCGTTGTATIQQAGAVFCGFDGATTAGDYVQNSISINDTCTDAGANYPANGQVLGRVTTTNAAAGVYGIDQFPPEILAQSNSVAAALFAGAGAGGGATITCSSTTCTDNGGVVFLATGTSPVTGALFMVQFGASHHTAACVFSPSGLTSAGLTGPYGVAAAGSFTLEDIAAPLTASTNYVWSYQCSFT